MCGIVGYIGNQSASEVLLSGLEKLEYRGYDSAGIAIIQDGDLKVTRAEGKLLNLRKAVAEKDLGDGAHIGIGHTRWATHGRPSETNAHPHTSGRISLIHNGIIENYLEIREELEAEGREFLSETDTEIAAQLLDSFVQKGMKPFDALKATCERVRGSYAFLALDKENPEKIFVVKNATPIVLGLGEGEVFVASDIPAMLHHTRRMMVLEDGDLAEVSLDGIYVEQDGKEVQREIETISWDPVTAQKGGYRHYMLKEIFEQPRVLTETFRGRLNLEKGSVELSELDDWADEYVKNIDRIVLVACGTAWHACLVAKFYLEKFARIPCEVDYGSEYRYRQPVYTEKTLVIAVSQSGETADTLAALDVVSGKSKTLAVCNVLGSSIARKVDKVLFTHAGPEISVASTKAFTTQLIVVYLLALYLGQRRETFPAEKTAELVKNLFQLPALVEKALEKNDEIERLAKKYHNARDFLFLGRGLCYPIALEGALKMKEISYIHAEGYPAGEMKHGPLALIDEHMPIAVVLQREELSFEKTLSNLREAQSRKGRIIAITDTEGSKALKGCSEDILEIPFLCHELSPLLLTIPQQLLSYHVAVFNGTDVDQPRNLAKSVTVE